MPQIQTLFPFLRYAVMAGVIIALLLAPVWLARQNKVSGLQMAMVRFASLCFGWTGIGWIMALYWAVKKA